MRENDWVGARDRLVALRSMIKYIAELLQQNGTACPDWFDTKPRQAPRGVSEPHVVRPSGQRWRDPGPRSEVAISSAHLMESPNDGLWALLDPPLVVDQLKLSSSCRHSGVGSVNLARWASGHARCRKNVFQRTSKEGSKVPVTTSLDASHARRQQPLRLHSQERNACQYQVAVIQGHTISFVDIYGHVGQGTKELTCVGPGNSLASRLLLQPGRAVECRCV
ncbi:hypothetical protein Bbelb_013950 [Branchiostoma belcheri]|nr:hypothetical protein Bbelb_013950 [Branchiostoma belcheri]